MVRRCFFLKLRNPSERLILIDMLGNLDVPGPYSSTTLPPSHAQPILLASNFFVLPDLGSIAYNLCQRSLSPTTIRPWITWCDAREKYDLLHVKSNVSGRHENGDVDGQEGGQGGFGGMASYINGSLASAMGLSSGLNGSGSGAGSGSATPSEKSVKVGAAWLTEGEAVRQDDWVGMLRGDM
jgi:hypothetical protein